MKKLFWFYLAITFGCIGYWWMATELLAERGIYCEERFWMLGSAKPACPTPVLIAGSSGMILLGLGALTIIVLLASAARRSKPR